MPFADSAYIWIVVGTLAAWSLKALALVCAASIAARAMRNRPAAARHALWTAVLAGLLALPVLSTWLPEMPVTIPAPVAFDSPRLPATAARVAERPAAVEIEVSAADPQASTPRRGQPNHPEVNVRSATPRLPGQVVGLASSNSNAFSEPAEDRAAGATSSETTARVQTGAAVPAESRWGTARFGALDIGVVVLALWMAGVLWFGMRLLLGFLEMHSLRKQARAVSDPAVLELAESVARRLRLVRPVPLLASTAIDVPLATGLFRGTVLLPEVFEEWPEARLACVLRHEMAHLKRRDAWSDLLGRVASVAYWFHPLVWMAAGAARLERERACDDAVLSAGTRASDYAAELLELATGMEHGAYRFAQGMARKSELVERMNSILKPNVNRSALSGRARLVVVAVALALTIPVAAIRFQAQAEEKTPAVAPAPPVARAKAVSVPRARAAVTALVLPSAAEMPAAITMPSAVPMPAALTPPSATPALAAAPLPPAVPMPAAIAMPSTLPLPAATLPGVASALAPAAASSPSVAEGQDVPPPPPPPARPPRVPEAPPAGAALAAPAEPPAPPEPSEPGTHSFSQSGDALDDFGCPGTRSSHMSMNRRSENGRTRWTATWSGDGCTVEVRAQGDITLDSTATAIERISPGGSFEISQRTGDTLRRVVAAPAPDGRPVFKMTLNGQAAEFGAEARSWLSRMLLAIERRTGMAAETRVPALLARGGPSAVLDEVGNLHTDYVRGLYLRKLFSAARLEPAMLRRALDLAGRMKSSYELARVLIEVSGAYDMNDTASLNAFFGAARNLRSDYERARVLLNLLERRRSPETASLAIGALAAMRSDYERARVLISAANSRLEDEAVQKTYIDTAAQMRSDYEKARALMALIESSPVKRAALLALLDGTTAMRSDYERARVLVTAAKKFTMDGDLRERYVRAANAMRSQHERNRALAAIAVAATI